MSLGIAEEGGDGCCSLADDGGELSLRDGRKGRPLCLESAEDAVEAMDEAVSVLPLETRLTLRKLE